MAENKDLIKKVKMLEDIIKGNKKQIDNKVGEICKLEEALKIEKERTMVREKVASRTVHQSSKLATELPLFG